jgi:hypothetical protein
MPDKTYPDPRQFMEFDEDDPRFQVRILGLRVDVLTREKEGLEKDLASETTKREKLDERVAAMEKTFQRGAGVMLVLPILGAAIGIILAYGKIIFAPWTGGK